MLKVHRCSHFPTFCGRGRLQPRPSVVATRPGRFQKPPTRLAEPPLGWSFGFKQIGQTVAERISANQPFDQPRGLPASSSVPAMASIRGESGGVQTFCPGLSRTPDALTTWSGRAWPGGPARTSSSRRSSSPRAHRRAYRWRCRLPSSGPAWRRPKDLVPTLDRSSHRTSNGASLDCRIEGCPSPRPPSKLGGDGIGLSV